MSHLTSDPAVRLAIPTAEAARLLGVSKSYLDKARLRGEGPPFARIGTVIRYRVDALREYVQQREATATAHAPQLTRSGNVP